MAQTPKNMFELLADLNSDSEQEETVVTEAPTPEAPPPAAAPPYQPTTPPFRPWPEGAVPPPIVSASATQAFKHRRRGRMVHHTSEDGWTSIRAVEGAPQTPVQREAEILYESRESPLFMEEAEATSVVDPEAEAIAARLSAQAPPQAFPSLLTRGRGVVLEGSIDAAESEAAAAKMWAEKISKSRKEAESQRGLSFLRRG